jgi:hypothetical protein
MNAMIMRTIMPKNKIPKALQLLTKFSKKTHTHTHSMFQSFQELLKTTSISPSLKSNLVLIPYWKLIRHG